MKRRARGYWVVKEYKPIKSRLCAPQERIEINDIWNGLAVSVSVRDSDALIKAAEQLVRMAAKRKGIPAWQVWSHVFTCTAAKYAARLPGEPYREPEYEEVERIDEQMGGWQ